VNIEGAGAFEVIASPWSAASVDNATGDTTVPLNTRVYIGNSCNSTSGAYSPSEYATLKLLGKTLTYTVDLSNVGCNCASTLYFVPMAHNNNSNGGEYYCDSNNANVKCAELDVQEGNGHAMHITLHISIDTQGPMGGYGGGSENKAGEGWVFWNGPRDFTKEEYGPGGSCVDTARPFQITAEFPTGADGKLAYIKDILSQDGCSLHTSRVGVGYGTDELTEVLHAGVTPVMSTWESNVKDMS
jgi:hypothetical protein